MRTWAPLVLVAWAAGCAPGRIEADLTARAFQWAALVIASPTLDPSWSSPAFGIAGGRLSFGRLPAQNVPNGGRVFLVALSTASFEKAPKGFDVARFPETSLEISAPPPAPAEAPDRRFSAMRIPDGAEVLEIDPQGNLTDAGAFATTLFAGLTLHAPTMPCGGGKLVPYAAKGILFAGMKGSDRELKRLARVAAGKVVALSSNWLWVIDQGAAVDTGTVSLPGQPWQILSLLSLAPGRPLDGSSVAITRTGALVGLRTIDTDHFPDRGEIVELARTPDGLRVIGTATLAGSPEPPRSILDLAFDDHGTAVAVGTHGQIFTRSSSSGAFRYRAPPPMADDPSRPTDADLARVIATHDPMKPHLIAANDGTLYLGNAVGGRWHTVERKAKIGGKLHFFGLAANASGSELWASGWDGELYRWRESTSWEPIHLEREKIPASFSACTIGAAGSTQIDQNLTGIAYGLDGSSDVFVVVDGCAGVLRIRTVDLCTSAVGVAPGQDPGDWANFSAVSPPPAASGAGVVIGGSQGALHQIEE